MQKNISVEGSRVACVSLDSIEYPVSRSHLLFYGGCSVLDWVTGWVSGFAIFWTVVSQY